MAITKQKLNALIALHEAEANVDKYRGICLQTVYEPCWYVSTQNLTIEGIKRCTSRLESYLQESIPLPSQKQVSFLNSLLSKDYNSSLREALKGIRFNKYQIGELITFLKDVENAIYSRYSTASEFDEFEETEKIIIQHYTEK